VNGGTAASQSAFGQILRGYRRASDLSQEELSDRAGVSVRTICDLERGRTARPFRQTVGLLADALGLHGEQRDEFLRLSRQGRGQVTPEDLADPKTPLGQPDGADGPRQLPVAVSHFTGRAAELDVLTRMLSEAGGTRTVVISALAGTAGVGKTAIAVQWAHQVADRFPDGQLYVNLRGYDPREPVSAADALAGFLRALGVPGTAIPESAEERSALYRSKMADRRVLVLLDNARDSEQVRPLLPADPGCAAVITSRDTLAGLVAADGALRLDLNVLPLPEAIRLLRSLIGPRADERPDVTAQLAGLCARLPLALRIAAELAAARHETPLAAMAAELARARLDLLDAGDDRADVRAVFSWSVRQLPAGAAETFALTGLHPGDDFDVYAAAALAGTTVGQVRRALRELHRASLLQAAATDRYGMHDLLRAYASEQATGDGADQALTRLFDYYLATAAAAMDVLFPAEVNQRPRVPPLSGAMPDLSAEDNARAWLDCERPNLVAVVVHCAGHNWPDHAINLTRTLFRYLMAGSHLPEAQTIYSSVLQGARRSGDLAVEASALNGLASIGMMKGHFREAGGHYRAALEYYRRSGDRARQASVLHNLGTTEYELRNLESAADYFHQSTAAYQDADDKLGAAIALSSLAGVEMHEGLHEQAAEHLQLSLSVFREAKDWVREAEALARMGRLSVRRGQLTQAADFFERAMTIYRRIGSPGNEALQLYNLGDLSARQGDYERAISYLMQALVRARQLGDQHLEASALLSLADALNGTGQRGPARSQLETALRLAIETGNTDQEASAHRRLGESHHTAGDAEKARHHWQQALERYTQLQAPEADQVRSRLAVLLVSSTAQDRTRVPQGRP
jgi:tetratricopeptide (TPR) repeat protein/transcriptional regulator with XRE-family HTH domain